MSALKYLNISHNAIADVNEIGDLSNLSEFDVSHNAITNLSFGAFQNLVNLAVLSLANNPIKVLDSNPFSRNRNLLHLDLSQTALTFIKSGTFLTTQKLQTIDLSTNKFKKFNFNLFLPRLPELQILFLDGNELSDMNGFRRSLFPNLLILEIQNNAFNCSYLHQFFEVSVWHELSISSEHTANWNEPNVGGIKCHEIDNEKQSTIMPTMTEMLSDTTVKYIQEQTTLVAVKIANESEGTATISNMKSGSNIEFLLVVLCAILITLIITQIALNKGRFLGRIACAKNRQNNFRSTTTLNTEAAVAFSCSTIN